MAEHAIYARDSPTFDAVSTDIREAIGKPSPCHLVGTRVTDLRTHKGRILG